MNALVAEPGRDAGGTGTPSQLTSVQPRRGSPCITTMPVSASGGVSMSTGSLTVISAPTSMANSLDDAASVIRPFAACTGSAMAVAYIVCRALLKPWPKTTRALARERVRDGRAAIPVVGIAAARLLALTAEPIRAASNMSGATTTNDIASPRVRVYPAMMGSDRKKPDANDYAIGVARALMA